MSQRQAGSGGRGVKGRLGIFPGRGAGGGVPAVPDGDVPGQAGQYLLVEHLADQAEVFEHQHLRAVRHRDAGSLLAPVLQGVQAEVGEFGDFFAGCPYAEHTTLFTRSGIVVSPVGVLPGLIVAHVRLHTRRFLDDTVQSTGWASLGARAGPAGGSACRHHRPPRLEDRTVR